MVAPRVPSLTGWSKERRVYRSTRKTEAPSSGSLGNIAAHSSQSVLGLVWGVGGNQLSALPPRTQNPSPVPIPVFPKENALSVYDVQTLYEMLGTQPRPELIKTSTLILIWWCLGVGGGERPETGQILKICCM